MAALRHIYWPEESFSDLITYISYIFADLSAKQTILFRRHSFIFPKFADKITEIIKSNGQRNVGDRQIGSG